MIVCTQCGDQHNPSDARCPRTGGAIQSGGPCGSMVDRYRVERLLGQGGMGSVYLARHSALGQQVALKLLRPELAADGHIGGRFLREAQAAAAIQHPHIVRVSDFGTVPSGEAFLVMEMLTGHDLDNLLERTGPLPLARAMHIMYQVLDALTAAHAAGVVHRDMKPANVFLVKGPNGDPDTVKLVDFGISKVRNEGSGSSSLTRTGMAIGTPAYMPPEQIFGAKTLDHRADIYAVAVMLFEMLTTRRPFEAESYEQLILLVVSQRPRHVCEFVPALPPALGDVILRGMAREPDQRFSSAREFSDALRQVTAGLDVPAGVVSASMPGSAPTPGASWPGGPAPAPTPAPGYVSSPSGPGYPAPTPTPGYAPPAQQGYAQPPAQGYAVPPAGAPPYNANPGQNSFPPTVSATGSVIANQTVSNSGSKTGLFVVMGLLAGGLVAGSLWKLTRKNPAPPASAQAPQTTGIGLPAPPPGTAAVPVPPTGAPTLPPARVTQVASRPAAEEDADDDDDDTDEPDPGAAANQQYNQQVQAIMAQTRAQIAAAQAAVDAGPPPALVIPPPGPGVRIGEPEIVGHGNIMLVKHRLDEIRGTMEECRAPGAPVKVNIDMFCQSSGAVSIVKDGDDNAADEETTRCVVNRIKTYYGVVPGGPQGILTVNITLLGL